MNNATIRVERLVVTYCFDFDLRCGAGCLSGSICSLTDGCSLCERNALGNHNNGLSRFAIEPSAVVADTLIVCPRYMSCHFH